jgi:hypothetical protein
MGVLPDRLFLSIRRSILRLRSRAWRRNLAFTRNPPLELCTEVFTTSNTQGKRRGFSSFSNKMRFEPRLIEG